MSRLTRSTLLTVALLAAAVRTTAAQTAREPLANVVADCTYASCALRIEPGLFGARLVRGAGGEPVGTRLGAFGGGVDPVLAGPDSAAAYARHYVRAASLPFALRAKRSLSRAVWWYNAAFAR